MDDELYTRDTTKSSRRRVEPDKETKQKSMGDKLKNETSAAESYRKKLRHGKADTAETLQEKKKRKKLQKQGRKKIYAEAAISAKARNQVQAHNEDDSVAGDVINAGGQVVETGIYSTKIKSQAKKKSGYGKKLHKSMHTEEAKKAREAAEKEASKSGSNATSKALQKSQMKKEIQRNAQKQVTKEGANSAGSFGKRFVDKAEDLVGRLAEMVAEFLEEHPMALVIAGVILLVVLLISATLTSCSSAAGGGQNALLVTSYTAEDEDIVAVNEDYISLEQEIQETIDNIETDYPGYDEYNYNLEEIGHNPYELAALLTVLYEDYTRAEVQVMLQTILEKQYTITVEEEIEIRTRTVTEIDPETGEEVEVEEEYEYYILNVTLTNDGIQAAVDALNLTDDQKERYAILLETKGNKAYLFEGDIYQEGRRPEDPARYRVPSEYLTDRQFGNMLHEAEKYLGMAYVWGGSSPTTGFDCSGFVSYVINNCGNGWDVGRLGAHSLYTNVCTPVSASEAKPGDLIFFKYTYAAAGDRCSHVGIYVGDGMMIHCGDPIKYSSINTSYWQEHFYSFGRINQ